MAAVFFWLMIIGVAGYQASGKNEVSSQLEKRGFKVFHMHEIVMEEVKKKGLEISQATMGKTATEIREKYSKGYIASCMVERTKQHDKVCIDGIRDFHEVGIFRNAFGGNFVLIAVTARKDIRFKRALSRGRKDDAADKKVFYEKDAREASWGLDKAIGLADYKVTNNGTFEEFKEKVKKALDKILNTK